MPAPSHRETRSSLSPFRSVKVLFIVLRMVWKQFSASGKCPTPSSKISGRYLVGKPHDFGKLDLIRLLWMVVEGGREEKLKEKFHAIYFLSLQKVLRRVEKPFNSFGQEVEMWLNLPSSNGNICKLVLNALRGKVKVPDRKSDNFMSVIGHQDKRVKLDKDIEPGNPRYESHLAVMASKLAYENKAFIKKTLEHHWKMEFIDKDINFWNDYQEKASTQSFMFHDQRANMIVVAFKGTNPLNVDDWCTDVDFSRFKFKNPEMGRVHGGFMKALGLVMKHGWPFELPENKRDKNLAYYSIRDELKKRLDANKEAKFMITGHSLGGALATLFPAILALHKENTLLERLEGVYTFGQPKVGNSKFKSFMEKKFKEYHIKYLRFVYCNDLVANLPPENSETSWFKHFGTCIHFDYRYKGEIVDEVPYKEDNLMDELIGGFFNGFLELQRSFYLPLLKGRDYIEGLMTMLMIRLPALVFPSVANHNLRDYDNATRIGSIEVFEEVESF